MDFLNLFIQKTYAAGILPDVSNGPITDIKFLDSYIGPGGVIITFIETVAGLIAVAMIIYSGFLFMTSSGDPEKVGKAKKALLAAIVGLAVVLGSAILVYTYTSLLGGSIN